MQFSVAALKARHADLREWNALIEALIEAHETIDAQAREYQDAVEAAEDRDYWKDACRDLEDELAHEKQINAAQAQELRERTITLPDSDGRSGLQHSSDGAEQRNPFLSQADDPLEWMEQYQASIRDINSDQERKWQITWPFKLGYHTAFGTTPREAYENARKMVEEKGEHSKQGLKTLSGTIEVDGSERIHPGGSYGDASKGIEEVKWCAQEEMVE